MIKRIVGGAITLIIGGTAVTVSQTDVANNFSKNAGVSQQQAQQYVNNINQKDLETFSEVGNALISDGNSATSQLSSIDCVNYTYQWETSALSCNDGKNQLQEIGNDEVTLGNCYKALDQDLGNSAKPKMDECISDIDNVDSDYDLPVVAALLDGKSISDSKNNNLYNKSVLQAALNSNP